MKAHSGVPPDSRIVSAHAVHAHRRPPWLRSPRPSDRGSPPRSRLVALSRYASRLPNQRIGADASGMNAQWLSRARSHSSHAAAISSSSTTSPASEHQGQQSRGIAKPQNGDSGPAKGGGPRSRTSSQSRCSRRRRSASIEKTTASRPMIGTGTRDGPTSHHREGWPQRVKEW